MFWIKRLAMLIAGIGQGYAGDEKNIEIEKYRNTKVNCRDTAGICGGWLKSMVASLYYSTLPVSTKNYQK